MEYWETEEYKAARSEDARSFAAWGETCDYRNLPEHGTDTYFAYRRDVVEPAKAVWWAARQRLNALRDAGQAAQS